MQLNIMIIKCDDEIYNNYSYAYNVCRYALVITDTISAWNKMYVPK